MTYKVNYGNTLKRLRTKRFNKKSTAVKFAKLKKSRKTRIVDLFKSP